MRDASLSPGTYRASLRVSGTAGVPSTLAVNGRLYTLRLIPLKPYEPEPDGTPDRAIRYIRQHGPQRCTALAAAIGVSKATLCGSTMSARGRGALFIRDGLWDVPREPAPVQR